MPTTMPVLAQQPDIYPSDLLDQPVDLVGSDQAWWAIYTIARREKVLMDRLLRVGIPFYSPLVKQKSRSPSGRRLVSWLPLFPSYVFLYGNEEQRYQALKSNCISRTMPVVDSAQLVQDLRQIRRLIAADAPLTRESRFQPGARVRVRSGSLAGLEGVVIKRRGQDQLLVAVKFLQQGASVAIEDFLVELID
jgi:transcriptional antiterminator RfaH